MVRSGVRLVLGMAVAMWLLEVADVLVGHALDGLGIIPRTTVGLLGVALAPFLHFGFTHLATNTVPFLVLGVLIAVGGAARVAVVTALAAVVSGFGVWLLAPAGSVTAGASGVVFGYAAYLIARGIVSRRAVEIVLGVLVVVMFGSGLIVGFVPRAGVSWLGHLLGAGGGVLAARLLHRRRAPARADGLPGA